MTLMRTLTQGLEARMIGTPGSWTSGAQFTRFVKLAGLGRRAMFIVGNGELDANMLIEVFEATDSSGTGAVELTGVTTGQTFVNGTDEGKIGLIEVLDSNLDQGYDYIGLRVTAGATDSFAAYVVISDLYESPAGNTAAEGVAFVVGGS